MPWQQKPETLEGSLDKTEKSAAAKTTKIARGAEKNAGNFSQRFAQARTFETSNKTDDAREIYEKLIVEFPDRYESYHRLGVVADKQRRHREAQSLYTEALRRKPPDPEIFNDLGYCFFLQGQLDKAESATGKAVALAPSNPRYRNNLGLVYGHQGRTNEALETFRRAGSEADAQYNMAFVCASQNDTEGAKERFRMALTADSSYAPARKALKSFEKAESEADLLADYDFEENNKGVRMVPYVEDPSMTGQSSGEVRMASASAPSSSNLSSNSSSTYGKTHALQNKAHEMMQARLSTPEN
jgi:tetratricopeptide (TPR) repeat protein